MEGFTTTATYRQGILIPRTAFPFEEGEVEVTVVPKKSVQRAEQIVTDTFGSIPSLPDGVAFINDIRPEWDRLSSSHVPA